jgi:hypothetical protein
VNGCTLHVCRRDIWAGGISLPKLSKLFRSRDDGYYFRLTMGITHVVVCHLLRFRLTFIYGIAKPSRDRMVMFFIGLLLYCLSIPGLNSRISFASISAVIFAFIAGCIWTTWESSNERGLLPDGFHTSITRALPALRPFRTWYRGAVARLGYFKRSVVKSFRNCFHPDDAGSVHSLRLAGPRDGVGRV